MRNVIINKGAQKSIPMRLSQDVISSLENVYNSKGLARVHFDRNINLQDALSIYSLSPPPRFQAQIIDSPVGQAL